MVMSFSIPFLICKQVDTIIMGTGTIMTIIMGMNMDMTTITRMTIVMRTAILTDMLGSILIMDTHIRTTQRRLSTT